MRHGLARALLCFPKIVNLIEVFHHLNPNKLVKKLEFNVELHHNYYGQMDSLLLSKLNYFLRLCLDAFLLCTPTDLMGKINQLYCVHWENRQKDGETILIFNFFRSNVEVVRVDPAADKLESHQHVIVADKAKLQEKGVSESKSKTNVEDPDIRLPLSSTNSSSTGSKNPYYFNDHNI